MLNQSNLLILSSLNNFRSSFRWAHQAAMLWKKHFPFHHLHLSNTIHLQSHCPMLQAKTYNAEWSKKIYQSSLELYFLSGEPNHLSNRLCMSNRRLVGWSFIHLMIRMAYSALFWLKQTFYHLFLCHCRLGICHFAMKEHKEFGIFKNLWRHNIMQKNRLPSLSRLI